MNPFQSLITPPSDLPCRPAPMELRLMRRGGPVGPRNMRQAIQNPWGLSGLQCAVARRLSTMTINDIGRALGITNKTVSTVVTRCREKMGVDTRAEVCRLWEQHIGGGE